MNSMRTPARHLAGLTAAALMAFGAAMPADAAGPTIDEQFSTWQQGSSHNPAGNLRINGDWMGSGGNMMRRANVEVSNGAAVLTSRANQKSGAELQSAKERPLGTGYYEASIKMSATPGVLNGFFFISENYRAPEVDIEVRSRDNGSGKQHRVFYSVHFANGGHRYMEVPLAFDPAQGHHTYGFLLGGNSITFYVDGRQTHQWTGLPTNLGAPSTPKGHMMVNSWAQGSDWTGPLPTQDARTSVNWMRHWAGATSPQFTQAN